MAEYMIQDTTLAGIANAIRSKTGGTGVLTPEAMAAAIAGLGGLPGCIAKIDGGTYTPSSDVTQTLSVNHDLGDVPDFFIMVPNWDTGSANTYPHQIYEIFLAKKFFYTTTDYAAVNTRVYRSTDGKVTDSHINIPASQISQYATSTTIKLTGLPAIPFKGGKQFMWICGKFKNYAG